jgi:hypothetical protein
MGICIFGLGDCGTTSTIKTESVSKTLNTILTNMVNTTSQTVSATQINVQKANLKIGNITNCKNVGNITQSAINSQSIKVYLDLSSKTGLQTQVSNALKKSISSDNSPKTGFLTTASTDANTFTDINEYIENFTSTTITDTTVQELKTIIKNAQNGNFNGGNVTCKGDGTDDNIANITQNMVSSQIVDVLLKVFMDKTVANIVENDSDQDVDNINSPENDGFGGFIQGIISTIAKVVGGGMLAVFLFLACPAIVLICCACALFVGKSHFGNKPSQFGKKLKNLKKFKKI